MIFILVHSHTQIHTLEILLIFFIILLNKDVIKISGLPIIAENNTNLENLQDSNLSNKFLTNNVTIDSNERLEELSQSLNETLSHLNETLNLTSIESFIEKLNNSSNESLDLPEDEIRKINAEISFLHHGSNSSLIRLLLLLTKSIHHKNETIYANATLSNSNSSGILIEKYAAEDSDSVTSTNQTTTAAITTQTLNMLQTTKIIPPEENPQFLNCIDSCGSDHECVRSKCLSESTYFGR